MKLKFKVGDKVRYKGGIAYDFGENLGLAEVGDIFIISIAGLNGNNVEPLYSVEGAYIQTPNWYDMEDNFELTEINWQKELE